MFLIVQNPHLLYICVVLALAYTAVFLLVVLLLCRPSAALAEMLLAQQETKKDLASIKSVQQDFVRHSRLNRKVIQLDKDITSKKLAETGLHASHRSRLFYAKVLLVAAVAVWFQQEPVLICDSAMLWPVLRGGSSVRVQAWLVAALAVSACQHAATALAVPR